MSNKLNFGEALEYLKQGKKVCREGWNGKDMFIYLVKGMDIKMNDLRNEAKQHIWGKIEVPKGYTTTCNHIDMFNADGDIVVGWLASQTDMLAEDWQIVE